MHLAACIDKEHPRTYLKQQLRGIYASACTEYCLSTLVLFYIPGSSIQISIKVVIFVLVIELALVLVLHGIHCTEYTQLNSPHPQEEQRWYIKQKIKQEKFVHLFGGVLVLEEPPAKGLAHIVRIMDMDQSSNPIRENSGEKD